MRKLSLHVTQASVCRSSASRGSWARTSAQTPRGRKGESLSTDSSMWQIVPHSKPLGACCRRHRSKLLSWHQFWRTTRAQCSAKHTLAHRICRRGFLEARLSSCCDRSKVSSGVLAALLSYRSCCAASSLTRVPCRCCFIVSDSRFYCQVSPPPF